MAQAMIDYNLSLSIDCQKKKEKQKIQQTVKEKSDMEKVIETFCIAESQQDPNFVTQVATFLIQNLNPIALDRNLKQIQREIM